MELELDSDDDRELDYIEVPQLNISNELLISLVEKNPLLYEKTTSKDFKIKELKLDTWDSIGETLGCTG